MLLSSFLQPLLELLSVLAWLGMLLASAGDTCAVVSADHSSKARGGAKPCAN